MCNYPLWNLPERICPECGTGFKPSDFEFVPSAAQFCCRGCMQPYYGTTWQGHLSPMEFACVRCGRHVHMDDTVVLPTAGIDEDRTLQGMNPWLDVRRGFFGRFFSAIGYAMTKPTVMARGTPMNASLGIAAAFAMVVNIGAYSICFGPQIAMMSAGPGGGLGGGLTILGFCVVASIVGMWAWGLLAHVILKLTGRTAGTIRHTYLAIYYAAGANTMSALVCVGFMFGWVWWLVSATLMLKEMQRISGLRAAAAALVPPLGVLGGLMGLWVWIIAAAISSSATRTATWRSSGGPGGAIVQPMGVDAAAGMATTVRDAIVASATANAGTFPTHPGVLIAYRQIPISSVAGGRLSRSSDETALLGGRTLRSLDLLQPGERLEAFQRAIASERQTDAAWRRMGDLVMPSLEGVTLEQARAAGLWVMVVAPDPDRMLVAPAVPSFWVIGVDGTPTEVMPIGVNAMLAEQNAARAGVGLPALEDPRLVRHWQPGGS